MSTTFRLDPDGNDELLAQIARGFDAFSNAAADAISRLAPENTGRYAGGIKATTFLENGVFAGEPIRGAGVQSKAQIWSIIYTTSPLGHLLELGTAPRDVVSPNGKLMVWDDKYGSGAAYKVHQPGMARHPHFWQGFASVLPRIGELIASGAKASRVRVNAKVL